MEENNKPDATTPEQTPQVATTLPPQQAPSPNPPPTTATPAPWQPPVGPGGQIYAAVAPAPAPAPTNAGLVVLQWLTYAFWGWTVLAMSILTLTVLLNLVHDTDTGGFTPYGIAAVLVLLPIAIVCDVFYSKQEPVKKSGASSLVMIIHAVLFALFGIGSLIGIVISIISLFTSSGDSSGTQVALYSTLIITVLYAAVFLRTINPRQTPWIRRFFPIFMTVIVGIISIMGIVGPVANARLTRNDRLISENISQVQGAITSYTNSHNALPTDLSNLTLSGDAKKLVADNLVEFKPDTKPAGFESNPYSSASSPSYLGTSKKSFQTHYYQLCVTYKKASDHNYRTSYESSSQSSDNYESYISAYTHPEGEVCYKLKSVPNAYSN